MSESRKHLEGLSPRAFQHPLDRTASGALESVPGLDWVIKHFINVVGERQMRLLFLASAVRVNPRQFERVHSVYEEACRILDIAPAERPELFVTRHFVENAATIGVDRPFIIVTSSLLEMMDDREAQCVLGHELGHVLCGHALYTTVLLLLVRLWQLFLGIPGGIYALIAITVALREWRRKAELSADRAGLLVSQDPQLSYRVDMKLAGGGLTDQMSLDEFLVQAEEYRSGGDLMDGVLKLSLLLGQTHPFPVLRLAELQSWVQSGAYEKILAGEYQRRDGKPESDWLHHVKETANDYKSSFDQSRDPLVATMRDLAGGAMAAGSDLWSMLGRATGRRKSDDDSE